MSRSYFATRDWYGYQEHTLTASEEDAKLHLRLVTTRQGLLTFMIGIMQCELPGAQSRCIYLHLDLMSSLGYC